MYYLPHLYHKNQPLKISKDIKKRMERLWRNLSLNTQPDLIFKGSFQYSKKECACPLYSMFCPRFYGLKMNQHTAQNVK